MATFLEVCEKDDTYKCDKCAKTFKAKEVKLEEAATNVQILTPTHPLIFVDKDGIIKGGGTGAEKGDRVLVCPHCNEPHIFGFDVVR